MMRRVYAIAGELIGAHAGLTPFIGSQFSGRITVDDGIPQDYVSYSLTTVRPKANLPLPLRLPIVSKEPILASAVSAPGGGEHISFHRREDWGWVVGAVMVSAGRGEGRIDLEITAPLYQGLYGTKAQIYCKVQLLSEAPGTTPGPTPQPSPGTPALQPVQPILYVPATCGWYADRGNLDAAVRMVARIGSDLGCQGRLGLDIEVTGDLGNLGASTRELWAALDARAEFLIGSVAPLCVALYVPMKINGGNTNDFGKGFKPAWKDTPANRVAYTAFQTKLAKGLLPYQAWIIAQAVAEQDNAMKADFRRAVQAVWTKAGWSKSHLAADDREGGVGYDEQHIKTVVSRATTGKSDFVSTDNDKGIPAHFEGGVWTAHKPKVTACKTSARAHLLRGTPFSLYHRSTGLHLAEHEAAYRQIVGHVADLLKAVSAADPSPLDGPRIISVTPDRSTKAPKPYIRFALDGIDHWNDIGGVNAWIVVNGVKVEKMRKGYTRQHLGNAYGRGEHSVKVNKGDVVSIQFQKIDRAEITPAVHMEWIWDGT